MSEANSYCLTLKEGVVLTQTDISNALLRSTRFQERITQEIARALKSGRSWVIHESQIIDVVNGKPSPIYRICNVEDTAVVRRREVLVLIQRGADGDAEAAAQACKAILDESLL